MVVRSDAMTLRMGGRADMMGSRMGSYFIPKFQKVDGDGTETLCDKDEQQPELVLSKSGGSRRCHEFIHPYSSIHRIVTSGV